MSKQCKYSDIKVGESVFVNRVSLGYCENCGSDIGEVGDRREATYRGHIIDSGNLYDVFSYKEPIKCQGCGSLQHTSFVPCGGITSGLFDTVRHNEEVRRQ